MPTPPTGLRVLTLASLTAVVLAATACGLPTASDLEKIDLCPSPVPAKAVRMQAPDSTLRVGATVQVVAIPVDAMNTLEWCAPAVQFASSNPGVAMVSSAGLVTGVSAGSAYIRGSSGTARDSVGINVVAATVASVGMR